MTIWTTNCREYDKHRIYTKSLGDFKPTSNFVYIELYTHVDYCRNKKVNIITEVDNTRNMTMRLLNFVLLCTSLFIAQNIQLNFKVAADLFLPLSLSLCEITLGYKK